MEKISRLTLIALIFFSLLAPEYSLTEAQQSPQEEPQEPLAKKIIPIGNIAVLGSYSKVCGGNDLSGLYASVNFAPTVKLGPRDYLIPLYSGLYKKQRQIISEEEGCRLYTTVMSHNFSLMQKHSFSDWLTQRICGFASLNYNKETSDESFGDGLYDYRDYGVFLDYQYQPLKTETATGTLLLGSKYYFRQYPNFKSLISLATQTASEEDEKDQHAWGLVSRYTYQSIDKLIFVLSYDFLFKQFTDKHTIDSAGVLEDGKRKDNFHLFKMQGNYKLKPNLILGLDGEIALNNSNQNYYDTLETPLALGDDVFVPHYFSYNQYEIRPSCTYLFPLEEDKHLSIKLSYAYTVREYNNRNVKNAQGIYQPSLQEDRTHTGTLSISFPLTRKLSLLFNADYSQNISNMEYERYYRYDYDVYQILSGLSYKF